MSNEFSTPKLTPADNVKIPGVDGNNDSGYLLSEEVKDYMVGGVYGETEEYSTLETYTVGQRVKNEGDLYRCTTAVAVPEVFDPTKWKKIDLPSLDEGVLNAETDVAAVRGTTDGYKESGKAYAIGDPCIQDNIVYVAKEAIADPAGTFDPTKWDQSDLVTLMLKAKENSEAISSLIKTVTLNLTTDAEGYAYYVFSSPVRVLSVFLSSADVNVNGWMCGFAVRAGSPYLNYYFVVHGVDSSLFGSHQISVDVTYQDIQS